MLCVTSHGVTSHGVTSHGVTSHSPSSPQAVAQQPVVIYFDAESSFQMYSGGIYSPSDCGASTNHAIVAVGYSWTGTSAGSYWIVRNSWGAGWGEGGEHALGGCVYPTE